jgi:uncharacterized repeat protein (TIGR02543 family)
MKLPSRFPVKKLLLTLLLIVCLVSFFVGLGNLPVARAQGGGPGGDYFTETTVTLKNGRRKTVTLPTTETALGVVTLSVPAFDWSFGCSATSASMIAAYYDRNGYQSIYTGPTGGGVMPLDSSVWPDWTDGNGDTYGQCPLTASHQNLDDRTTRGSIDDYWIKYLSNAQDPFITNGWTQHAWGDAIGDYMKTSQSTYGNVDGSTVFYNWNRSSTPLTCTDMENNNITVDGTYGRKEFYEAKGYSVTDCYNQSTDNIIRGGFSFAKFQAEIDAGRPVMLNLKGHTIVGVGYDSSTKTVYLHDTWDYSTHTMIWGGSYAGLKLQSVSIVNLAPVAPSKYTLTVSKSGNGSGTVTSSPSGIDCGGSCSHAFAAGTSVTLTAAPAAGSTFAGWSGGSCSGTGTCTVSISSDRTVTATFNLSSATCYSLTTSAKPNGSGTVTVYPSPNCGTNYISGTVVTLTAVPNPGYTFSKWTGSTSSTQNPLTVTMNGAKTYTANFKRSR